MLAVAALAVLAAAQSALAATCTIGANVATFNQCVYNGLVDNNGQPGAADQFQACVSLQNTGGSAYYQCLCARSQTILSCYSTFCPGDQGAVAQQQYVTQFCGVNIPSVSTSISLSGPVSSLPPLPTFGSGSATQSTAAPTGSSTGSASGKNAGEAASANMLVGAIAIGVAGAALAL
ncbi:hypothetical protein HK105_204715 [Polyrhizophydium stewartii]|uniref:Uncharacterized protein n=1 Tax=Polyrhizophydium stewartii TaxID=2732419 RepID=A0ABR4N8B8_9FUNG